MRQKNLGTSACLTEILLLLPELRFSGREISQLLRLSLLAQWFI